MTRQAINIGANANDRRGDSLRAAFQKVNANFTDLYTQVENISTSEGVDLTGYATEQYVDDAVDAIEIPDVSNFITAADIPTDFKGSVFADDSTLLVDAVNASIPYSVLSGAPTIPANLNDLSDVNTISPANGDLLMYANGEWVNAVLLNNIVSGSNISLLNNDAGYITAASIPTDFKGSVFADDSTLLVDGVNGKLVGNLIGRWEDDNGVFAITAENVAASFGGSTGFSMASNAPNGVSFALSGSGVFGPASFTIGAPGNFTATVSKEIQLSALEDVNISSTSGTINLNGDVVFSDNSVQTTAYTGYHTGDMTGSVFADDSTLLVDGVSGTVPGTLTGNWNNSNSLFNIGGLGLTLNTDSSTFLVNNIGLTFVASEGTRAASLETSVDRFSYDVTNDTNSTSFAVTPANLLLTTTGGISVAVQGSVTMSSGPISASVAGAITISNDGNVSWAANGDFSVVANNININSGGIFANTFTGDVRGSVFADDSTLLVDGVNGSIPYSVLSDAPTIPSGSSIANGTTQINIPNEDGTVEIDGDVELYGGLAIHSAGAPLGRNDIVFFNSGTEQGRITAEGEVGGAIQIQSEVAFEVKVSTSDFTNETALWLFTANGKVEFPDETAQTTAWAGGRVVNAPATSAGAEGDKEGDIAFDNDYFYYCTADYTNGQSDIWKRVAWSNDTW